MTGAPHWALSQDWPEVWAPSPAPLDVAGRLTVHRLQVWDAVSKDMIYLPSRNVYGRAASATNSERLASVKADFNAALEAMKRQAERANKVEKKVRASQRFAN